jgi:hypothetical protein
MFPPDVLPPGVYVSSDEAEVTSPLSLAGECLTFSRHILKNLSMIFR